MPGCGVASGMVVGQDDPRAAVAGGVGDYLPHRNRHTALIAVVARKVDAAGTVVDMRNPEMFAERVGFGEAVGEEAAGRFVAVEQQRGFGTLMKHADCLWRQPPASDWNRIRNGLIIPPKWR